MNRTGQDLQKLAQLAGVWADPTVRALVGLTAATGTQKQREALAELLSVPALEALADPNPFLPYPELDDVGQGEIRTGEHPAGGDVRLPLLWLTTHLLETGPTGIGKTFHLVQMLTDVIKAGVPIWVFDTQGEYARFLAPLFPRPTLEVISYHDFRRNPFEPPPGTPQKLWIDMMCHYMREAFFYRDRTIELHRRVYDTAALVAGLQQRSLVVPSDYVAALARLPKSVRYTDQYDSLQRFARALRRPTYWCLQGFDLDQLSRRSVIFDLSNMPADFRLPFVADLVMWQQVFRPPSPHPRLDLVMVFDELAQFVSVEARQRSDLGEGFFFEMLRGVRKRGMGVVLADQTYSTIHAAARSNCRTKIVLETSDGVSRRQIAADLGLTRDQEEYLAELGYQQRRGVIQMPTYPHAFLFGIPDLQPLPRLTDEAMEDRRQRMLSELTWTSIPEGGTAPEAAATDGGSHAYSDGPSHDAYTYLCAVVKDYFVPASVRDHRVGFGGSKGTRIRDELKRLGLVEEREIQTGKQGGIVKLVLPTEAGYRLLDDRKLKYRRPAGNGSIEHQFWQATIARFAAKRGWMAHVEGALGPEGKRVDVGAERGQRRVAYEVFWTDLEKETSNYRLDTDDGWDRVVFCCRTEEDMLKLQVAVAPLVRDGERGPEFRLLASFWEGAAQMA